ncbi:MAG: gas vesicle protein GvpG [Terriglobales bacterium]
MQNSNAAILKFGNSAIQRNAAGSTMLFIDDLLLAPITGFKFILRTVQRIAEEQYTDDAPVKERLLELQVLLDSREITEDEYVEREGEILRELRAIENRKRELAGVAPEEGRGPLSGRVAEGSGASVNLTYGQQQK